mmetsp:Transcript_112822/g.224448  ORF Transcript_112822/g.224448 Transcript_112822/m.224448 type:complete len:87 (+) Transcript_112822:1253-1513(+)
MRQPASVSAKQTKSPGPIALAANQAEDPTLVEVSDSDVDASDNSEVVSCFFPGATNIIVGTTAAAVAVASNVDYAILCRDLHSKLA